MNRFDKIKTLNIDDMASFLSDIQWDSNEPSMQEMYEWLTDTYIESENDILYVATDGLHKELEKMQNGEIVF